MSDEPKSDELGLRGTLDLVSQALRTAGTANATGAITAGASYRYFSDQPDLQWAIKHITLVFLFGVLIFALSYTSLLSATFSIDSLGRSSAERKEWEHILWLVEPQKTPADYAKSARRHFLIALLSGGLSALCFAGGLAWVIHIVSRIG